MAPAGQSFGVPGGYTRQSNIVLYIVNARAAMDEEIERLATGAMADFSGGSWEDRPP